VPYSLSAVRASAVNMGHSHARVLEPTLKHAECTKPFAWLRRIKCRLTMAHSIHIGACLFCVE
jgi:hypothetical protein